MRHLFTCLLLLLLLNAKAAQAQLFFTAPTAPQNIYGFSIRGLATADFNGDGRADVVVSSWCGARCTNQLQVYLTNADGTLQPAISRAIGLNPLKVIATDVTGDNKPDILLSYVGITTPSLFVNQGNGSFGPEQYISITASQSNTDMAVADFNNDGRPDLLLVNSSGTALILLNTGSASSGWLAQLAGSTAAAFASNYGGYLGVADLNQDSKLDFIYAYYLPNGQPAYSTRMNNGTNTAFTPGFQFSSTSNPVLVDLDKDGKADILATTATGPLLYRNLGAGTFGAGTSLGIPTAGTPLVTDFDGDGQPDFLFSTSTQLIAYRNLGTGAFAPAFTMANTLGYRYLAAGDINGDGRPDVAIASELNLPSIVSTLLNTTPLAARATRTQPLGISPSPATDEVRLHLPAVALPAQVRLYTMMGQLTRSYSSPDGKISVLGLSPGLYTVQVQHQEQQWTTRLQVQ